MADYSWTSKLCVECSGITYKMFTDGFEHPLTFDESVGSGHTCGFCRLMVCTFSKLQVKDWDLFEIDQNYRNWTEKLKQLRYMVQTTDSSGTIQEMLPPPKHLHWIRDKIPRVV